MFGLASVGTERFGDLWRYQHHQIGSAFLVIPGFEERAENRKTVFKIGILEKVSVSLLVHQTGYHEALPFAQFDVRLRAAR